MRRMSKRIHKVSRHSRDKFLGKHRFEHWLVDNQVYFITARCRDKYPAFAGEAANRVFWDRLSHYTAAHGFVPWITSLLDNHYHTIGYLRFGNELSRMMQRIHGSTAKLVNDLLPQRRREFWRDTKGRKYFDGCIRDERQARLAYRYIERQAVRHGIVSEGEN